MTTKSTISRELLTHALAASGIVAGIWLTGCNDAQQDSLLGAGAGAGLGAIIGHNTGGHTAEGAAIGAGVGALTGYIIGNESDKSKQQTYYSREPY